MSGTAGARILRLMPGGTQLKQVREALGLSQEAIARRAGLSRSTVGDIEHDRAANAASRLRVAETLYALERHQRLQQEEVDERRSVA